jgi:hypothetical protein
MEIREEMEAQETMATKVGITTKVVDKMNKK